eukprot:634941-Amphidinium_carterae.1
MSHAFSKRTIPGVESSCFRGIPFAPSWGVDMSTPNQSLKVTSLASLMSSLGYLARLAVKETLRCPGMPLETPLRPAHNTKVARPMRQFESFVRQSSDSRA